MHDWDDETEPAKEEKRNAANRFLLATQPASPLRDDVKQNRVRARIQFAAIGGIAVPADVDVVCLEPDPQALEKCIVLALLEPGAPAPAEPWRVGWLGALQTPPGPDWRAATDKFLLQTQAASPLRDAVLSGRARAREQFAQISGLALTPDTQVICLKPDRHSRARQVVLELLPTDLYKNNWLAAWPPYR